MGRVEIFTCHRAIFQSSRDIFRNIGDISKISRYFWEPKISRYFVGDISACRKYRDIFEYRQYFGNIINENIILL